MKRQLLALLLLLPLFSLVAEKYELNVQEAVDLAIERNLSLKIEEINLRTKEFEKNMIWNQFLPKITFTPAVNKNLGEVVASTLLVPNLDGGSITNADGSLFHPNSTISVVIPSVDSIPTWAVQLGLSGQWVLNAGMFVSIDATLQDYQNGLIGFETAVAQLERDVKKSYYNLIFLEQVVLLIEENLATAQRRFEQAEIKYENGYLSTLDLLRIQSMVENIRPTLTGQRHYYQLGLMNFKVYLGLEFKDELSLTENRLQVAKIDLNLENLIDDSLTSRLDIQLLMGNLNYLQKSRTAFLTGQLSPSVIFALNYSAARPLYAKDKKPTTVDWIENSSFSIGVSVPIDQYIPGSSTYVSAKTMQNSVDSLKIQLRNALRLAEMDIRSNVMNLDKSWQNIESLGFNINLNREVYNESENAYNAGQIDLLDLEDAENSLRQARIDSVQERVNYLSTIADLEYSINSKIDEFDN